MNKWICEKNSEPYSIQLPGPRCSINLFICLFHNHVLIHVSAQVSVCINIALDFIFLYQFIYLFTDFSSSLIAFCVLFFLFFFFFLLNVLFHFTGLGVICKETPEQFFSFLFIPKSEAVCIRGVGVGEATIQTNYFFQPSLAQMVKK